MVCGNRKRIKSKEIKNKKMKEDIRNLMMNVW